MFVLGATLTTQMALGATNVILLAPIWLQITHLLVAEMFWILLVGVGQSSKIGRFASHPLIFYLQNIGVPLSQ